MALSPLTSFGNFGSYPVDQQISKTSSSQVHASFEKAFIDITTSEGDTVSFQRSTSHMAQTSYRHFQTSSANEIALQSQTFDEYSFSYVVQGDLSDEELQDIGELFDSLSLIAEDFYRGDLDKAMAGALTIGDLGSLSSLSATFSKSEVVASKTTTQQHGLTNLPEVDHSEDKALVRQRQAQWQQILNYLDKRKQEMDHLSKKEVEPLRDHGQEMQKMIKKTLERHQRLEPLIKKLVDKAINNQQQKIKPENVPAKTPGKSIMV